MAQDKNPCKHIYIEYRNSEILQHLIMIALFVVKIVKIQSKKLCYINGIYNARFGVCQQTQNEIGCPNSLQTKQLLYLR